MAHDTIFLKPTNHIPLTTLNQYLRLLPTFKHITLILPPSPIMPGVRWIRGDIDPPSYAESVSTDQLEYSLQHRKAAARQHLGILSDRHHTCRNHEYHNPDHVEELDLTEYSLFPSHFAHHEDQIHTVALPFSLQDFFCGKEVRVTFRRWHFGNRQTNAMLSVRVPPNCPDGKRFPFKGVGHQLPNGRFQDIYFVIEEEQDDGIFHREGNNLRIYVKVPWQKKLETQTRSFHVSDFDGEIHHVNVDYPHTRMTHGIMRVHGKGMPRYKSQGRGDFIIE